MENNHFDVIIVGAGPAGSTSALRIAKNGYKVLLLDKSDFPRDKSCGDGLTRTSTKLLSDLGIFGSFSNFKKIKGVSIFVENEGCRQFDYPGYLQEPGYGLVVPRLQLDNILCQKAIENGAVFMNKKVFDKLLYQEENKKVIGVRLANGEEYFAEMVIGADGAASKIAYQSSLATTPKNKLGFGLRGYYSKIERLSDKLEIYLPILDSSNKRILPSYGWVFPVDDNVANIGVGLIEKTDTDNIHSVMEMFVNKLKKTDDRFQNIELQGKHFGAPMRFDFKPENTFSAGLLLVGDAAGMISPFTGEGIGYAIETGIIASNLYLELKMNKNENFSDLSKYGKILASKYQGYFETGTNSVNRYHLVWKVLKGTFQNDKPLFSAIRQATVFPEGIGESFFDYYTEDVSYLIKGHKAEFRTDMLAISENLINITREDWPFLSRLFSATQITPGIPFRPSLFLLLSGYTSQPDRDTLIKLGTAIELGFAASLCHNSVMEERSDNLGSTLNWGNMISILVGDFLLSKSFETISVIDAKFTKIISEAIAHSNQGLVLLKRRIENDVQNISLEEYLDLCHMKYSYTFEMCMYLGSQVRKAKISDTNAIRTFGRHLGAAYFIVEDTIKYSEKENETFESTNLLYSGDKDLSLMNVLIKKNNNGEKLENEQTCAEYCFKIARVEIQRAISQLNAIEDIQLKESLINISEYVLQKVQNKQ
ncbi:MAG TPA: geranylgeranyl reductase family protein [Chitinophagaceae bacterium]|nr:geranylgeranyl reductase family protein [Chitinophagaceae bacterium]